MVGDHAPEILDRLDAQLRAQPLQRLGAEPLDAQQLDHAPRMLLPEALELGHLAGLEQLADLLGGALADAVDPLQLGHRELAEVGRLCADGLRGALVGTYPERLRLALVDQGQLRELLQHVEHVLLAVRHG